MSGEDDPRRFPLLNLPPVRAYLERVNARMTSIWRAAVHEQLGRYEREVSVIHFNRSGEVRAPARLVPLPEEESAIANAIVQAELPSPVTLEGLPRTGLPPEVTSAADEDRYIFKDRRGNIIMLQVRVAKPNGDKRYVPWTYWSDGVWRACEPEGQLPLYGMEHAPNASRVFVHEGAKAARAATKAAQSAEHPWRDYLATGCHVGWIGGAHMAHRADWAELRACGPDDIVIMPDNDPPGEFAVPGIARQFRCPVRMAEYDSTWPDAWDIADPLPEQKFESGIWIGPDLQSLLVPAEWATDQIPQPQGRPITRIREEFAQRWIRIERTRQYSHILRPDLAFDREAFNDACAPFSHAKDTAQLLSQVKHPRVLAPTFRPDLPARIIRDGGKRYLNQYLDHRLKPSAEPDTSIFWEFIDYLFPNEEDRFHMKRWMATLYTHPEVRMNFGVLALSRRQGVGKSTIGVVLARLIGLTHCAFPGDSMITQSDFNGWLVNKRLVVVHEIYAGQNWRAYNKLKTLITDEEIEANIKFQPTYTVPNWAHFYCASNSMEALRVERDDRRWFVPQVTEELWPRRRYQQLWTWIRRGGLHGLAHDLNAFGSYVELGESAPKSDSKHSLIDASRPEEEILLQMLLERLQPGEAIASSDIWLWLREKMRGRLFLSPQRCALVAKSMGFGVSDRRVRVNGSGDAKQRIVGFDQPTADEITEARPEMRASKMLTPDEVFARGEAM